jgi:hypothetical protein
LSLPAKPAAAARVPRNVRPLGLLVVALADLLTQSARADEPASPTPLPPAEIILVGEDATCASVKDVVTELLSRDGMTVTWASQEHFRPQDIFDRVRSPSPAPAAQRGGVGQGVAAWIDLSAPAEARLYFRDAGADRFFIRSLPLARGIDEIAKEEIAHIVSNAVLALSQGGGEALTRSEARQALQLQPTPEAAPEASEKPLAPLRFAVAAMAGAQLFASELPVVGRGTLSLALTRGPRWNRTGGSFGGWLDLGYQLPGRYQGSAVGADVQAASARAGVLWEIERSVLLRLGLGTGVDRVHYQPRGDRARVELASASSFYVPALSFWAGMDLRLLDWLALTSRISVDAALAQVHFDLHDSNGQTTRVLIPYAVLPAASLGLAVVF